MVKHIWEELARRELPSLSLRSDGTKITDKYEWEQRKDEIFALLLEKFTGYPPELPYEKQFYETGRELKSFGGKADTIIMEVNIGFEGKACCFPFTLTIPNTSPAPPVFLFLSFDREIAGGIGEEIIDQGYAIANVCYQDITKDEVDKYHSGIGVLWKRTETISWGKLMMWAWGASRIMDYLETDKRIDAAKVTVMGHSRLGKTALLAGAFDNRFALTASFGSGAGGAALFRGKTGQQLEDLYEEYARIWFTEKFFEYKDNPEDLPFDQHFLLALIAPRHLYVAGAVEDFWADPKSEFLSCIAAGHVYEYYGTKGVCIAPGVLETGAVFPEGRIGYHLRKGTHYLSRDDWKLIINYRKLHNI